MLDNHVLLLDLLVQDNSVPLINSLGATWLPLLGLLNLEQNRFVL